MMEDKSTNNLKNLFSSLNDKFCIVKEQYTSDECFEVTLRTQLPTAKSSSEACDTWKNKFSSNTNTDWVVKETFPNPTDYVYRKTYVCQQSAYNKSQKKAKCERYTKYRNRNCEAKIDIKILKDTIDTRKKHKFIKEGLTTVIKVRAHQIHNFKHSLRGFVTHFIFFNFSLLLSLYSSFSYNIIGLLTQTHIHFLQTR